MQELGYEEFSGELIDRISRKIVSRTYLKEHSEFVNAMTFDLFELYVEGWSLNSLSGMAEAFFYNLFAYKPSNENMEEIIDIP